MTLNRWVLSAALVVVLGGINATARADGGDGAPLTATPVVTRSADYEAREREHRAKLTKERESKARFAAGARNGLFGLALLVILPTGMSIYTWSKRRTRRVTVPLSVARRLGRACVVTGSKEDLERERVTYQHTSTLANAVGLLSLVSIFTGGILYRPGKRRIELDLGLSAEGRRLADEGRRQLILSQLCRALLFAGFLAAAVFVKVQLLWALPLVLALTVPVLLAEKAAGSSTPTCLGMTDDSIHLEFARQDVAERFRRAVARA